MEQFTGNLKIQALKSIKQFTATKRSLGPRYP